MQTHTLQLPAFLAVSLLLAVAMSPLVSNANVIVTELDGDINGNVIITAPGHYVDTDGETFKTVTIQSDDVTLDGLIFDGQQITSVAVKNGAAGLNNIAILNSTFTGYTGRTITTGFAEGVSNAADRGSNFQVSGNTIKQYGANATAIAIFNNDGVVVTGNTVTFDEASIGRRGLNLDGNTMVSVMGNTFEMVQNSPWAIQISMSDAEVEDVVIQGNTMFGSTFGIVGLSQRDLRNVTITNNEIDAVAGIALNSGSAKPVNNTLNISGISVHGNNITAEAYGVSLRDLHTPASAPVPGSAVITYTDVKVNGNRITAKTDTTDAVRVAGEEPDVIYSKVKISGNPIK